MLPVALGPNAELGLEVELLLPATGCGGGLQTRLLQPPPPPLGAPLAWVSGW